MRSTACFLGTEALVNNGIKGFKCNTDDPLTQEGQSTLEAAFSVLAILEAVFSPDSPLAGAVPAHGDLDLVNGLVQQLDIAYLTFLSGTENSELLAAYRRLPVKNGKTD